MMINISSLFLQQSYEDTWAEYKASLVKPNYVNWDYVILTASNEKQAEGFRLQLKERKEFLPKKTKYVVISDLKGERIGSGGATLSVLKYIKDDGISDFSKIKALVIHSGGDSKRVPQYSALGKIFSPVPRLLPDGRTSTLFDEIIISMSSMAGRIREGMLLLSGDVLLLFNPLQVNFSGTDAAVISFKEDVETGKNHGVFLCGKDGNVRKFLHKQTVEKLKKVGAVNERNAVDIDTGAVIFSPELLESLYSLVDTEVKYSSLVNSKVRLSLYGDFLYPLASDSSLEDFYKEKPEGEFCKELEKARKLVFTVISKYKLKLLRLSPSKFVHFGTTHEVLSLLTCGVEQYGYLNWNKKVNCSIISDKVSGYNGIVSNKANIGVNCYVENSYVHRNVTVGDNVVLSNIEINDGNIPNNVVIHGLKQRNGKFVVRIYGINDNPKENKLFGKDISFLHNIWDKDSNCDLWNAKIYKECDTIDEALKEALNLYKIVNSPNDKIAFNAKNRKSLSSGFNDADSIALASWNTRMKDLVIMESIFNDIQSGVNVRTVAERVKIEKLSKIQKEWLDKKVKHIGFSEKIRLFYYLGVILGDVKGEKYLREAFNIISKEILSAYVSEIKYNDKCKIAKSKSVIKLPLRVNFGGGWSDTPPYCNENGGKVINAAILLNNEKPVEVSLTKIKEKKIIFDSRDMDVHGEFEDIKPLQVLGDPYDPFALQKACLVSCGIIPTTGGDLHDVLDRLGGGFIMQSEVNNVPKGSGLGTSSILSAACVKAVFDFMGITAKEEIISSVVLCMEQIMSTGGGWQDQIGGATDGFKYITSKSGMKQEVKVEHLKLGEKIKKEFDERFIIIYTGQRRLARNLLRDVIGRYLGAEKDSLFALNKIKTVAEKMRAAIVNEDFDEFIKLFNYQWELSKKIDSGCTNTLINQIFLSIEEFIDGKFICGAGGGGFLQAILKKGCTKEQVHDRLKEIFQDNEVDVFNASLVY